MNIGDLFMRVLADMAGFESDVQRDAQRAGDRAGQTMGQRIGGGVRAAAPRIMAGVGAAVAGLFVAGGHQLAQLDSAMAQFRADTGATEEEVKSASDSILEASRRNLQGIEEIASAQAALRTELGLTQEQAEDSTQAFLDYATATGQDATEGVRQFDDILDAWGLDASESQGLMDQLIASHQKYGGNVGDNAAALGTLAPQLQALNMGVDDGVGLLNLFAASGLDASSASAALNTAVRKLKPGQDLNDLIAEISAIEDPTLRAQAAVEVFGARGGVRLANALRPGVESLDDFIISQEEAAGATDEAAQSIEDSWGNRVKLWIKNIAGLSAEFLQNLGPGIGGVAAMIPVLSGPLGGLFKLMSGGALTAIPALIGSIGGIGSALMAIITGPIGLIVAAVAGLFIAWQTNFLGIRDIVGNVVDWFMEYVWPTIEKIFSVIAGIVETYIGLVIGYIELVITVISTVVGWILDVAVPLFSDAFGAIADVIGAIVGTIVGVIEGIIGVVATVAEAIGGFFDFITGGTDKAKKQIGSVGPIDKSGNAGGRRTPGGRRPPSYDVGSWRVPDTGLAFLHADEMVVPPGPADVLRAWFAGGGSGFGGMVPAAADAGGGDTINVYPQGLMRARSTEDIGSGLKRLAKTGMLTRKRRDR